MRIRMVMTGIVIATFSAVAYADDVAMKDLPEAVRKAVVQEAKDAKIEDLEREKSPEGKVYYELELERGEQEWTVRIDEAGKVIERKRDT